MLQVGEVVVEIASIAAEGSGNFNRDLGFLSAETTVYIGVGPDGPESGSSAGNDFFTWDFSIARQSGAGDGQFSVNPDQSITYMPSPGFVGTETINYQISDGRGGFDTASLSVTTLAVEDDFLPGDANQNGVVDFSGIPAFISILQAGEYLVEADLNQDELVDFSDIGPFIDVLISQ